MAYQPFVLPPSAVNNPAAAQQAYRDYTQAQNRAARNSFFKTAALGSAALAVPAIAPSLFGGSAAASAVPASIGAPATVGAGTSIAAPAASKFTLGGLLELGKLGAGLFGAISGNHSQAVAATKAQQEQQREFDLQQQMLRQQMAADQAEKDRVYAESQRQFDAQQAQAAQVFKAQEEERIRNQQFQDYQQQLLREREQRAAPRRALSQQALIRLQDFLHLGR